MSSDLVTKLQERIQELELELKKKDQEILALSREVPLGLGHHKTKRLNLSKKMMQQKDHVEGEIYWTGSRVRDTFISFFEDKCQHTFFPGSPVVPHNDPTLLFINSGMCQFKPIFLGNVDPNSPLAKLSKAVNSQPAIRAGGKHNDLEDVGKDTYHHTMFEMLGNWSFGDYFKKEAIAWAWELLTKVYGLPEDRLYVTYFEGNDQVPADVEAKELWKQYVPENRILPGDSKDNFWEMGDTGPCGPCSEIHYDRIGGRDAAALVNQDDPDVLEIWNLVFMQYNRKPNRDLEKLPACHVDTGMGFERLVSALQDVRSNYDTDIFAPLFEAIHGLSQVPPYGAKVGADDVDGVDMAYRVVADHIRTLSFAISDGAYPSKEGRGYVLRRILRRAVRYGMEKLKMERGSFAKLVSVLVGQMKDSFPNLAEKEAMVYEVILDEEETFARTLTKGVERFTKEVEILKAAGKTEVPGRLAFFLYQSMGFPIDLTQLMAEERGLTVDIAGFEKAAEDHIQSSSKGGSSSGEEETLRKLEAKETSKLEELGVPVTEHSTVYSWHQDLNGAAVKAIFDGENFVDSVKLGDEKLYGFILDKSNFYYESGGQMADQGRLKLPGTALYLDVKDCQSAKGFIVHVGRVASIDTDEADEGETISADVKEIKVGDAVTCCVDYSRRGDLAKNHTCTHILNFALRKIVSSDVDQKGSLVTADKLRFDFNSTKALTLEQQISIEQIVRQKISESLPVHTKVVPLADAMRINALRAVFGETYPDPVRVVTVGPAVDDVVNDPLNEKWSDYSVELCGGTHLGKSSEARAFSLVSEGALAKGIRRVICVTGDAAYDAARLAEELRSRLENTASLSGAALVEEHKKLSNEIAAATISVSEKHELLLSLEKLSKRMVEIQKAEQAALLEPMVNQFNEALERGDKFFVYQYPGDASIPVGRISSDFSKKTKKTPLPTFLIQGDAANDNITVSVLVPKPLVKQLSATEWANTAGACIEINGGGGPPSFNGKGTGFTKLQQVIDQANEFAKSKLA